MTVVVLYIINPKPKEALMATSATPDPKGPVPEPASADQTGPSWTSGPTNRSSRSRRRRRGDLIILLVLAMLALGFLGLAALYKGKWEDEQARSKALTASLNSQITECKATCGNPVAAKAVPAEAVEKPKAKPTARSKEPLKPPEKAKALKPAAAPAVKAEPVITETLVAAPSVVAAAPTPSPVASAPAAAKEPVSLTQRPEQAFQGCPEGKYLVVDIWDKAARQMSKPKVRKNTLAADGKPEMLTVEELISDAIRDREGRLTGPRVSREFWKVFLDAGNAGTLARARKEHLVEIFIVNKTGTLIPVAKQVVKGGFLKIRMPSTFEEGGVLRVVFHSPDIISPISDGLHAPYAEYQPVGCGFSFRMAAIER